MLKTTIKGYHLFTEQQNKNTYTSNIKYTDTYKIQPLSTTKINTSFGPIYKKYLNFLVHCINDVFGLYSRQDTSISQ